MSPMDGIKNAPKKSDHEPIRKVEGYNLRIYRNNLKNREFGKEAAQIFWMQRATIARGKARGADGKFAAKQTRPKTDSSSCFGIGSYVIEQFLVLGQGP